MAKAVYTTAQVVAKLAGTAPYGANGEVTYGFTVGSYGSYYGLTSNLNDTQKAYVGLAMREWDGLSTLRFTQASTASAANIKLYNVSYPNFAGAQIADQIMLSSSYSYMLNPGYGGYGYMAIMHEIGHALGLNHPGNYNGGSPTYAANAAFMQDSQQYTVMSYFSASNTGANHGGYYASTLLLYDIAAIQKMYGADMTTRTGDSVYGFSSNVGGAYDFTVDTHPIICIWDAGGTDTINVSGFTQDQVVNLNAGQFSDVGGLTKNLSIAFNCNIENAVGGSGNDTLIGNALANVLTGGDGNDTLTGGDGADRLVGGSGNDTYNIDAADTVVEQAGQGIDTVQAGFSYTLGDNVENLVLTGTGALTGTGNGLANYLVGNTGNNVLDGKGGADVMAGGKGNDTYVVDNSGDSVAEAAGQGTDTVQSSVTFTLSANVENLTFTGTSHVNGTGNELANVMTGNSGNNVLSGGAGNDTLYGGDGNDTLIGGAGTDILCGGAGADCFVFDRSMTGRDTIKDFSLSQGDSLNIHDLIMGTVNSVESFVRLTASGNNTLLQVDQDGSASAYGFVQVALLENTRGLTLQGLLSGNDLIL